MTQRTLFDAYTEPRSQPVHFPGPAYVPERDEARLVGQQLRVFESMKDGEWRTIQELARIAECPENSASSQLRQLRWESKGGHTVNRRHVGGGLYEYQLVINGELK